MKPGYLVSDRVKIPVRNVQSKPAVRQPWETLKPSGRKIQDYLAPSHYCSQMQRAECSSLSPLNIFLLCETIIVFRIMLSYPIGTFHRHGWQVMSVSLIPC
jgi:hypothetical protein